MDVSTFGSRRNYGWVKGVVCGAVFCGTVVVEGAGALSGLTVEDDDAGSRMIGVVVGAGDQNMRPKTATTSKIVTTVTVSVVLFARLSPRTKSVSRLR